MIPIFCGADLADPQLITGQKILGTRYKCMQKGIGLGKFILPLDQNLVTKLVNNVPYVPVNRKKYYCGNASILPAGYSDFGDLDGCLRKGVAIGKKLRAAEYVAKRKNSRWNRQKR